MPDNAGAEHAGDKFVFPAVPGKKNRAGTAAAIEFSDGLRFAAVEADLILRYASRPQKPDNVRAFFAAQADVNRQRALAEVAGSSKDFPLLVKRTSENFHLRSDGALVVIERFQIDLHPAVFLGTVIFQQQR